MLKIHEVIELAFESDLVSFLLFVICFTLCYSEVRKLPCFDVEVPEACMFTWRKHYEQYRQDMSAALQHGQEGKNEAADEVIIKYKKVML